METIGERIKKLRESHNLTSAQFGEIAGVTKGAVSQWESDITDPKAMPLMKISRDFNISIDYLLFGEDENEDQTKINELINKLKVAEKQGLLKDQHIDTLNAMLDSWFNQEKPLSDSDKEAQKTA